MKIVTNKLLSELSEQARKSPRLRLNQNFHTDDKSRCHRLLNAIEPASYIRPHRHLDPEKDEAFIILSGRLGILIFSDQGEVLEKVVLSIENGNLAADIKQGIYHTAVSLESGTIFYETKAGPYLTLADNEKALWAPADGTQEAIRYLESLKKLFLE